METYTIIGDPAAVYTAARSLHEALEALEPGVNLSDAFSGYDECMRRCMKAAIDFENWASDGNIIFEETVEVWPYMLHDRFGEAVLRIRPLLWQEEGGGIPLSGQECVQIAHLMNLPDSAVPGLDSNKEIVSGA